MRRKDITIHKATSDNLEDLTMMNYQLNLDERYDGRFSVDELTERMESFLKGSTHEVYTFRVNDELVGYVLIDIKRKPLLIKDFFIRPESRRIGLGKRIMKKLFKDLANDTYDIDIMAVNRNGRMFLKSCGFKSRVVQMRYSFNDIR